MVDTVSIIVAVLALAGTIAQAAISAWITRDSEEQKRQRELKATFAKYHDPLHLAADDLSSKLLNIIDHGFAVFASENADREYRDYAYMHTSFVFGQFFAWYHILRRDTQFLRPYTNPGSDNAQVTRILSQIRKTCRTSSEVSPFMIFSGNQLAIGESMVVKESENEGSQLFCMGYATFSKRWKEDAEFREWFEPIIRGLLDLNRAPKTSRQEKDFPPDDRLRRLQHLLVDLLEILDPHQLHSTAASRSVNRSRGCLCSECKLKRELNPPKVKERYAV